MARLTLRNALLGMVIVTIVPFAVPQEASAQVGVTDSKVLAELKAINTELDNIKAELDTFETYRDDVQTDRYDKMVTALSFTDGGGSYGARSRTPEIFTNGGTQYATTQERLEKVYSGDTKAFGVRLGGASDGGGSGGSEKLDLGGVLGGFFGGLLNSDGHTRKPGIDGYREEYALLSADALYKSNGAMQRHIDQLHQSIFLAEAMAGETALTRDQRLELYEKLQEQAAAAKDVNESMEVANAIMLENGRNLALLIDLETIRLNAEASSYRQAAQDAQQNARFFGASEDSLVDTLFTAVAGIASGDVWERDSDGNLITAAVTTPPSDG